MASSVVWLPRVPTAVLSLTLEQPNPRTSHDKYVDINERAPIRTHGVQMLTCPKDSSRVYPFFMALSFLVRAGIAALSNVSTLSRPTAVRYATYFRGSPHPVIVV